MQIKIFELPADATEIELEPVNKFLRSNRILSIDREFHQSFGGARWSLLVVFQPLHDLSVSPATKREKPDYKKLLTEDEFERYSRLRVVRKRLADAEAVPAYAVFTNEELAKISQLGEINRKSLSSIIGIGDKRVEKYAEEIEREFNASQYETSRESEGEDM